MVERVIVFIDYENTYWAARTAFHAGAHRSGRLGHVDPMRLSSLINAKAPNPRTLVEVRVYRGMPSPLLDSVGYRAWRSQASRWEKSGATVVSRVLRYPVGWLKSLPGERPQEKGIDVALALDVIDLAHRGAFDVAVIVSIDSDILPAIEMLQRMRAATGSPRVEVAAWRPLGGFVPRLRTQGRNTWCHWLHEADYRKVQDLTDYSR